MVEGCHCEPLIQLRIVKVLKAELQHLPPLVRIRLVDVDVSQCEREPERLARPGGASDDTNPPVIDMPVFVPLQNLSSHKPRGLQAVVQVPAAEGPDFVTAAVRVQRDVRPFVGDRVERVAVDQIREPD